MRKYGMIVCRKLCELPAKMKLPAKMPLKSKKGMELVQVGILIAIAVGIGLIFKEQIKAFVDTTFSSLLGASFS